MHNDLPITEDLDFAYLLELMLPLHRTEGFSWLPELFSIVGVDNLVKLCKYAGGETITIPTLQELNDSIDALQWFYDIRISKKRNAADIPSNLQNLVIKIAEVYDARDCETLD